MRSTISSALLLAVLLTACAVPDQPAITASPASAGEAGSLDGLSEAMLQATAPGNAKPGLKAQAVTCPTQLAAPYNASVLDTGLYWYAPGETSAPGGVGCKAKADGSAIAGYYDPSKPVMIFVHGWQNGSVQSGLISGTTNTTARDNFWFTENSSNVADAWLAAGWNVGLFQWTQLADDEGTSSMPYHSQAKIWTPGYTYTDMLFRKQTIKMRYRVAGGTYSTTSMPTVSAGQLFYNAYKSALSGWTYNGPEKVRVMGHSLGAQMALAMTEKAYADTALPASKKPGRVILADPYWTPSSAQFGHSYSYLSPDANPSARSARIAQSLKTKGAVVEWIKTSRLVDMGGDNNLPMAKFVSRTEVFPEYITDANLVNGVTRKHLMAPRWYFLTRSAAPRSGVSAANAFSAAQTLMNSGVRYDQDQGKATVSASDDTFVSAANP